MIQETLLTADAIQGRIREMAKEIVDDHPYGAEIHLVGVLKGGFMFMSDLVRATDQLGNSMGGFTLSFAATIGWVVAD